MGDADTWFDPILNDRTRPVYERLVGGDILADHGFTVPARFPVRVEAGGTGAD